MRVLIYDRSCGFSIVEADDLGDADERYGYDAHVIDDVEDIPAQIIECVEESLEDSNDLSELRILKELEQKAYGKYIESCGFNHTDWLDDEDAKEYRKLMKKHFDVEVK